jgi:hypothetical protein
MSGLDCLAAASKSILDKRFLDLKAECERLRDELENVKVYIWETSGAYRGGVIVSSGRTPEEALERVRKIEWEAFVERRKFSAEKWEGRWGGVTLSDEEAFDRDLEGEALDYAAGRPPTAVFKLRDVAHMYTWSE